MKRLLTVTLTALALCAQASAAPQAQGARRPQQGASRQPARPAQAAPAARPTPTPAAASPAAAAASQDKTAEACGCEAQPLPQVLAVVNGVQITRSDLSQNVQERVRQYQQQVIDARARELDLQINSKLLEAEAKKRGTTTLKILEAEVVAKTTEPTEAEARAFYDQNKARIPGEFASVRSDIVEYLRYQRQQAEAQKLSERLRAASQVQILSREATPPATPADRARVLATVNGEKITSGDIEDALRPLVYQTQEQAYMLRKNDVDTRINDMLLEQEAKKRNVTTTALFDTEVKSKVAPVTEADAQKFYNENKERINGDFAQIKSQIIEFLRQQAEQKAAAQFAQALRNSASVQTFLVPPPQPVYQISTEGQPSKGSPTAAVTVVEFTDFQCPACAQTHPVLERVAAEYGDRVRVVLRDFPLEQHREAQKAAEAAEAAREQGKFWEYVALLYGNQSALQVPKLKEYASQIGLDRARFDAALDSGKYAEQVRRDMLDGQKVGVDSTPTLFINGRRVNDRSYEGLKGAIEAALKSPAKD